MEASLSTKCLGRVNESERALVVVGRKPNWGPEVRDQARARSSGSRFVSALA